jgi:pimeloyl-ACP methyl ester carboxylesterase
VVLLAGSGNTAHVFDEFAPKLSGFCHVYGITRRGYGLSGHPESGYGQQRLADDVLAVIDALKIASPVLVGHSMSGEELTTLGDEHSDRLGGLVYMDAAADPTDFPASSAEYMQLFRNLPAPMRDHSGPSASDRSSFQAYREWQIRSGEVPTPESELRMTHETNPDGSVGKYTASTAAIHKAVGDGALKRDYSQIRVPILAFFPSKGTPKYQPKNTQESAAVQAFDDATAAYVNRWKRNMHSAPGGVRIVNLPGANHYLFISNEADVLKGLQTLIASLH